jgi:hypothetical protein
LPDDAEKVKPLGRPPQLEEDETAILQSMVAEEMDAAKAWGIRPGDWYELPRWERVAMVAYVWKQEWAAWWREKLNEKKK